MPISQPLNLGVINKLAASVTVASNPLLTVTPPFLAKPSIRLAPEGDITKFLDVLTGAVPSVEPYQLMTATIALVKTLPLCALYQAQFQTNSILGTVTIRPDVSRGSGGLQPFILYNCALMSPREMDFGGDDPAFTVTIKGTWQVNSALWSGLANIAVPA